MGGAWRPPTHGQLWAAGGTRTDFPGVTTGEKSADLGNTGSLKMFTAFTAFTKRQKHKWEVKSHFYKNICFEL